jgi:hypothetical protein
MYEKEAEYSHARFLGRISTYGKVSDKRAEHTGKEVFVKIFTLFHQ